VRPLEDAQRDVLAAMQPLPVEHVTLSQASGLCLAEDLVAPHDVPPFDNSGMDGFAVRSADVIDVPVELEVLEDVPAGTVAVAEVGPGTAIKIMTGAPMPVGADAVVIVEDSEMLEDRTVRLRSAAHPGQHVRSAGGDIAAGDVVLAAGTRLGPAHLGLLASIGVAEPLVRRRPVVAVLSTGDEVSPADTTDLKPGAIRDSNRPILIGLLEELGARVIDLGIVPDDERLLRGALGEASEAADAVITSGGVSMGEYDLVKQVLGSLGHVEFWRVAMQPAKPFAFGFLDDTPLFGLPGNPVSVAVAFEQFVRPALLHRMGARALFRRRSRGIAGEALSTNPDKVVFLRVTVTSEDGEDVVRRAGGQSSNVLSALAAADAFAVVPVGAGDVAVGDTIELEWFRAPESRTMEEAIGG
jgi:molybdenum cofactor synthesis domain-containing protein